MKRFVFVGLFGLTALAISARSASAQAITSWTARTYLVGATAPLSAPVVIQAANVVCGQAVPTVTGTANPTQYVFDDPTTAGTVCIYTDPGNGPLASAPFGGNYEGTLTATNAAGTSPESNRAPFTHPGLIPGAPTGLRGRR